MSEETETNVVSMFGNRPKPVQPVATRRAGAFLKEPRPLNILLPKWLFDVDGKHVAITSNTADGAARSAMQKYPKAQSINFMGILL